jgi:hypothetical protein
VEERADSAAEKGRSSGCRMKSCLIGLGIVLLVAILLAFLLIPLLAGRGEPVDVEFNPHKHTWESPD